MANDYGGDGGYTPSPPTFPGGGGGGGYPTPAQQQAQLEAFRQRVEDARAARDQRNYRPPPPPRPGGPTSADNAGPYYGGAGAANVYTFATFSAAAAAAYARANRRIPRRARRYGAKALRVGKYAGRFTGYSILGSVALDVMLNPREYADRMAKLNVRIPRGAATQRFPRDAMSAYAIARGSGPKNPRAPKGGLIARRPKGPGNRAWTPGYVYHPEINPQTGQPWPNYNPRPDFGAAGGGVVPLPGAGKAIDLFDPPAEYWSPERNAAEAARVLAEAKADAEAARVARTTRPSVGTMLAGWDWTKLLLAGAAALLGAKALTSRPGNVRVNVAQPTPQNPPSPAFQPQQGYVQSFGFANAPQALTQSAKCRCPSKKNRPAKKSCTNPILRKRRGVNASGQETITTTRLKQCQA